MDVTRMLLATPAHHGLDIATLGEAVDSLGAAALTAGACADACLDEYDVRRDCIVACLTVSDVAGVAARTLCRTARWERPVVHAMVDAAARALSTCASACEAHGAVAKHCQVCAEECRRAERACQQLLAALAAQLADLKQ
jgi:conjugal transfer/entry exclusion protein